ncbi:ABC transporter permease subunit [Paludisphaera mucosa]|uniref:ABC transporter permease subunit n=1 Tax=Paludisphaera mucosa TaxID=3030827 RepID=A0ABT6FC29_9BACT|nr:ABC transporter permease subunit [Paludisphaera mucosa]MDG3005145.1 ABC transporter permease subunit [Paludisphaera mucosa]
MKPFWTLVRKNLHDVRWSLFLSIVCLFALGWLLVYVASLQETRIRQALSDGKGFEWVRQLGLEANPPSIEIMMAFWNHPFIILLVAIWSIGRGANAVGAEIERGTLDMVMSRPVSRSAYLASQVLTSTLGLLAIAGALAAGAYAATFYNFLKTPPAFGLLMRPAFNLAALAFPMYGYTLLVSAIDIVRWRALMVGSVLTLGGFIARVIAVIPVFKDSAWRPWAERASLFTLYNPVDAVSDRSHYDYDVAVLLGLGSACIALAFLAFAVRDLPANS